jgi:hypothetical protein
MREKMEQSWWIILVAPSATLLVVLMERIFSERSSKRLRSEQLEDLLRQFEANYWENEVRVILDTLDEISGFVTSAFVMNVETLSKGPFLDQTKSRDFPVEFELRFAEIQESMGRAIARSRGISAETAPMLAEIGTELATLKTLVIERYNKLQQNTVAQVSEIYGQDIANVAWNRIVVHERQKRLFIEAISF